MPTANMVLTLPTENGSDGVWDVELNAALTLVDAHDHTSGKGVAVPTAGIGINADLTFAGFAGTNMKAARFTAQASIAALTSGLCVKSSDNELYWVTSGGTEVKLTSGAGINTTLVGGITGDYSSTDANLIYSDAEKAFQFIQNDTTTPDTWALIASEVHRLYPPGNGALYIALRSPALAGNYTLTLPAAAPVSTSVVTMSAAGLLITTRAVSVDSVTATGSVTGGSLDTAGVVTAASTTITGEVGCATVLASGNVKGNDIRHGNRLVSIAPVDGYAFVGAPTWNGTNVVAVAGDSWQHRLPLHVGDRIRHITFYYDKGGGDLSFIIRRTPMSLGTVTQISSTVVTTGSGLGSVTESDINHVLLSGSAYFLHFGVGTGAGTSGFHGCEIMYDRL